MSGRGITISGQPLAHMLYHFRSLWSGFAHAHGILGGESYVALAWFCAATCSLVSTPLWGVDVLPF